MAVSSVLFRHGPESQRHLEGLPWRPEEQSRGPAHYKDHPVSQTSTPSSVEYFPSVKTLEWFHRHVKGVRCNASRKRPAPGDLYFYFVSFSSPRDLLAPPIIPPSARLCPLLILCPCSLSLSLRLRLTFLSLSCTFRQRKVNTKACFLCLQYLPALSGARCVSRRIFLLKEKYI